MSTPKKKAPKKKAAATKALPKEYVCRKGATIDEAIAEEEQRRLAERLSDKWTGPDVSFAWFFSKTQLIVHENAKAKGFWDKDRTPAESIALMHSELSEALEAYRNGNPKSKKIKGFSHAAEEFADAVIRIMDLAEHEGIHLGAAIIAKIKHNAGRLPMHGKEF
jgi:NTP pyrophosphatase (non-canonical NTP hydrolase)